MSVLTPEVMRDIFERGCAEIKLTNGCICGKPVVGIVNGRAAENFGVCSRHLEVYSYMGAAIPLADILEEIGVTIL